MSKSGVNARKRSSEMQEDSFEMQEDSFEMQEDSFTELNGNNKKSVYRAGHGYKSTPFFLIFMIISMTKTLKLIIYVYI